MILLSRQIKNTRESERAREREREMAFTSFPASRATAPCSPPALAATTRTTAAIAVLKRSADAAEGPGNEGRQIPTPPPHPALGRRNALSACFAAVTLSLAGAGFSHAAILEADDDVELLERVKMDRKKRLERQGVISSSRKETGYLQELVYKLSKVGQAIDNNDVSSASSVLGPSTDVDWVQKVNMAFTKLSSGPEEKIEVDTFNSSLASLFTSVGKRDIESSKRAFVSSASALEKWVGLSGLVGQLKGI